MSASYDTLLQLAALTRSASENDLRELDRELDALGRCRHNAVVLPVDGAQGSGAAQ